MNLRDPYTKLIFIAAIFILVCALLAASAFAATPAFSVHKNGTAQTVTVGSPTKLTWSTEIIDTNANFATDRFTPTVAGNYLIVVSVQCAQPGACVPAIYKNGALYAASRITNQTFADQSPQATAIVSMNGTTDYVEAFATSSGNSISGIATQTYFSGSQIDGAGTGSSQWVDGSGGAIYYNGGNVGIGTASPGEKLEVAGSVYTNAEASGLIVDASGLKRIGFIKQSGLPPELRYLSSVDLNVRRVTTGTLAAPTSSDVPLTFDVTGNIGIGTEAPLSQLTVRRPPNTGNVEFRLGANEASARDMIIRKDTSTPYETHFIASAHPTIDAGALRFFTSDQASGEKMVIHYNGNVGIGTTAPAQALDVNGNIRVRGGAIESGADNSATLLTGGLGSSVSNSRVTLYGPTHPSYAGNIYLDSNNLTFRSADHSSFKMIINSSGNVGIGTTSPGSDLEIEKTAAGGGVHTEINNLSTANNSFTQLVLRNGTGNVNAGIQNNQGTGLPYTVFFTGSGVTGGMYLDVLANAPLIFRTNAGAERMRVTGDGNVGIGTAAPAAKLHVAGNIRLDSPVNATAGRTVCMSVNGDFHAVSASTCYASDERLKTNIKNLPQGQLELISKLRGVTFEWKMPGDWRQGEQIGLIAQDVEKVYPQLVNTDSDGRKSVDYEWLVAPIIESVKELKAVNDNQAHEIETLRRELEALKAAR